MSLHLSRIRLKHAPDTAALARLLLPPEEGPRIAAAHRLLWSLFADGPDRRRDFLWREDGGSSWQRTTFLVLSARAPEDRRHLFDVETKDFAPALAAGQRLRFRLRAAPAFSEPSTVRGVRGKRVDPVWHRLRASPPAERAGRRLAVQHEVLGDWLARQGGQAGFAPVRETGEDGRERVAMTVDGDLQRRLPARKDDAAIRFTSFDLEGLIVVGDPALFRASLARGFGRAKAFGCGLMLIRRP